MTEKDKYSETERLVCYKHKDGGVELSMIFNKETKTVDISLMMFHRTDEPTLEPMGEDAYSATYGHWQTEITCLGAEDIEFLHQKSIELFGQQNQNLTKQGGNANGSKVFFWGHVPDTGRTGK